MRKLTTYNYILLFSTILLNLVACEELTAGGPGHGGTGPFITVSDEIFVLSASNNKMNHTHTITAQEPSTQNSPAADKLTAAHAPSPTITIVEQSENGTVCGDFSHTISVLSYKPSKSNEKLLDVVINTRVINNSDKQQIEIKENCTSYDISNNNINDNVCNQTTEKLLFLPKQMHDYKLTLMNVTAGSSYSINYKNKVMTHDNQCATFLNFEIN